MSDGWRQPDDGGHKIAFMVVIIVVGAFLAVGVGSCVLAMAMHG